MINFWQYFKKGGEKINEFSNKFLWGGASAANQYEGGYNEGGKGLACADLISGGSHTASRQITTTVKRRATLS